MGKKNLLPKFLDISTVAVPPASILLFYNGNKVTEFMGKVVYRHKYNPPAFHAALYIGGGLMLNVGKFVTEETVESEFRSTRRVDVIIYHNLTAEQRGLIIGRGYKDLNKFYDIGGFLSFGKKIPLIGKALGFLKGSKKLPFCSDHVTDSFGAGGQIVSQFESENTAPWHLLEYALLHPSISSIHTLHIGPDYPFK